MNREQMLQSVRVDITRTKMELGLNITEMMEKLDSEYLASSGGLERIQMLTLQIVRAQTRLAELQRQKAMLEHIAKQEGGE